MARKRIKENEIPAAIEKVEKNRKAGMSALEACKGIISYPAYLKFRKQPRGSKAGSSVQKALAALVEAIRRDVLEELQDKLKS